MSPSARLMGVSAECCRGHLLTLLGMLPNRLIEGRKWEGFDLAKPSEDCEQEYS